ncbi:hypothetical protein B0T19DRAFT_468772 [Cercophora scortea]|uniref:Clr5 domain-containing protein n=1 Tax=Cercophora scortea TaxID=314031 RepID=A0AAE0I292_9PEZI|nr:hypothetical protein B0T19DRAFT_468772 [Cercophora scortea]
MEHSITSSTNLAKLPPSEAKWLTHKRHIWRLYIEEKVSLSDLVSELRTLGLSVTDKQVQYRLNQWKFYRNIKGETWKQLGTVIKWRQQDGKKSEVIHNCIRLERTRRSKGTYRNTPPTLQKQNKSADIESG